MNTLLASNCHKNADQFIIILKKEILGTTDRLSYVEEQFVNEKSNIWKIK